MCSHGKLIFKYGTMGAGKSALLLTSAYNFQENGIPILVLKSEIDTRDGENVIHSRALKDDRACVSISPEADIFQIITTLYNDDKVLGNRPLKWILIDEAQFLTEKQVEECAAVADNLGVNIICYGLRTDFRTRLFPGSKRLFELADSLEELKSSCRCDSKTICNARIDKNGKIVTDGEQIEVGGDDRYVSLCRKCYFERAGHPLYNKQQENED